MLKLTNNKQELPMTAMSVNKSGRNVQLYKGLSTDASYKVSVDLAKRLQRRKFLGIDQPDTRIAYGGHVCK